MPTNLYVPRTVPVVNGDFEASSVTLPPPGWQIASPGCVTSYNTSDPYEGTQSLVITATEQFGGVTALARYPVKPGQIYRLTAALRSDSGDPLFADFEFFDIEGNLLSPVIGQQASIGTVSNSWLLLSAEGIVPPGAVLGVLDSHISGLAGGIGEIDAVSLTLVSTALSYYLSLLTSQYQSNSPKLQTFITAILKPLADVNLCVQSLPEDFDLDTAVGSQLDELGLILATSRTLPFQPTGVSAVTTSAITVTGVQAVGTNNTTNMAAGSTVTVGSELVTIISVNPGVGFTANFLSTHLVGVSVTAPAPSAVLDDDTYRILLKAKVIQNQWDGQVISLWASWQSLFPGGTIYIIDNQNMTATIILTGNFTVLLQQMILNGLIVPRPETVQYNYTFGVLPLFGFDDLNPTFIAGFDAGHWG